MEPVRTHTEKEAVNIFCVLKEQGHTVKGSQKPVKEGRKALQVSVWTFQHNKLTENHEN